MTLDIGARFGQQYLEDGSGCFLVEPVLRIGGRGREAIFQEGDANTLGAADFLQRGGRPEFALHHLGKESQPDADDPPFLGQAGYRLLQELLLFFGQDVLRQFPKSTSKSSQYLSCMV